MATPPYPGDGRPVVVSDASGTLTFGNGSGSMVSRWRISVVITVGTATLTPKTAISIVDGYGTTQPTAANQWYTNAQTNAQVAAGTAITANGIYDVDSTGCDLSVAYTTAASGVISVVAWPLLG